MINLEGKKQVYVLNGMYHYGVMPEAGQPYVSGDSSTYSASHNELMTKCEYARLTDRRLEREARGAWVALAMGSMGVISFLLLKFTGVL